MKNAFLILALWMGFKAPALAAPLSEDVAITEWVRTWVGLLHCSGQVGVTPIASPDALEIRIEYGAADRDKIEGFQNASARSMMTLLNELSLLQAPAGAPEKRRALTVRFYRGE